MKVSYTPRNGLAAMVVGLMVAALVGCGQSSAQPGADKSDKRPEPATARTKDDGEAGTGAGMDSLRRAAEAKKYLFAFFWKEEDEQTKAMRKVFDAFVAGAADRADGAIIQVNDEAEKAIVQKYELDRAPMPLVLAIAPNGAVMGGFPKTFSESALSGAFGSPCSEQCMKALQANKLVFVCVQNGTTNDNEPALQGVRDFKADARFAAATEIVMLDPVDAAEASFLADLKIDPKTPQAVTAFLAPPGSVIAEYNGATDMAELIATIEKASSGACGPGGCGPGGCGPK